MDINSDFAVLVLHNAQTKTSKTNIKTSKIMVELSDCNDDNIEGLINCREYLLKKYGECQTSDACLDSVLAYACCNNDTFYDIFRSVVEGDEFAPYDECATELDFIAESTYDKIIDDLVEGDYSCLYHFQDAQSLYEEMMASIGYRMASELTEKDVLSLGFDRFSESIICELISSLEMTKRELNKLKATNEK